MKSDRGSGNGQAGCASDFKSQFSFGTVHRSATARSPLSTVQKADVPTSGAGMSRTQIFLSVGQTRIPARFLPRSGCDAPCFGTGIRSGLALCDVLRSTNTGLPPALRRRCRSLRRAVRPFVMVRKPDEIHRLQRRPRREAAPGPRKASDVPSMPYGQRRDTTGLRGQHIPIHAPACA